MDRNASEHGPLLLQELEAELQLWEAVDVVQKLDAQAGSFQWDDKELQDRLIEYLDSGCPLGPSEAGFERWLGQRP
jgi:hypothetical protein